MTSIGNARLPYEIREFSQAYGGGMYWVCMYWVCMHAESKRKHAIILVKTVRNKNMSKTTHISSFDIH
jgi:hypothetical protein